MAAKNPVMRVTLTGDADGAVKALRAVANELARTDARYKTTADAISREADRIAAKQEQVAAKTVAAQKKAAPSRNEIIGGNARSSAFGSIDSAVGSLPGGGVLDKLGGSEALLGGISTKALAASAGVAAIGTAAVVAGQKSVAAFQDIGGQVQQFAFLTGQSAEASSGWVGALNASGVGVDQWVDRVRQFQTNLAQSEERFTKAGVGIRKFSDGTTDATSTMWAAIQKLHDMPDLIDRQRIGFQLFGESWTQLRTLVDDPDSFTALRANFEGSFTQEDLDNLKAYNQAVGEFKTEVTTAAAEIGSKLVPMLTTSMGAFEEATTRAKEYGDALLDIVPGDMGLMDIAQAIPGISQGVVAINLLGSAHQDREEKAKAAAVEELRLADAAQQEAAAASAGAMANARMANEIAALGFSAQSTASILRDVAAASSQAFSATVAAQRINVDVHDRYVDTMASVDQISRQAAAAQVDSAQQVESASNSLADAQNAAGKAAAGIGKAQQQAAKSVAAAAEQVEEAYESQAEAVADLAKEQQDAQKDIVDFEEDAAEKIEDAQQRIIDARDKANDKAVDNARKLFDAQTDYQDALIGTLDEDNPFEAQRAREKAALNLQRTKEDIAKDELESAKDIADALKDKDKTEAEIAEGRATLAETINERIVNAQDKVTESAKNIGKAQENLAETEASASEQIVSAQEAAATAADGVTTAQQNLDKAYSDTNTTVGNSVITDGQKETKLREIIQATYDEVAAAKARGASEGEIQKIIDTSKDKVDALGLAWNVPVEKITTYQGILTRIPTEVSTNVTLKMDMEQFRTALYNAALEFEDPLAKAYVMAGGENLGGGMPVLNFSPPGSGRAIGGSAYPGITYGVNETGKVETLTLGTGVRGYVNAAGSGSGTTNIFQVGMFASERSFEAFLADMRRKGYNV